MSNQKIDVNGTEITIVTIDKDKYISITDIAKYKEADRTNYIIQNWMRNTSTIEFLGLWEQLHNPDFKGIEFDAFRNESGTNSFTMTPKKWIETTNAIGIISKAGRYGGTYAHQDIAFEFATWISAKFKLYLLKEFQRLKIEEMEKTNLAWDVSRILTKINYSIHTDAIKNYLIPDDLENNKKSYIYAGEADLLNIALFGKTAQEWKDDNPDLKGNIRDNVTIEQLVVLSNIESYNAELIKQGISADIRMKQLNKIAINQLRILIDNPVMKQLKNIDVVTKKLSGPALS